MAGYEAWEATYNGKGLSVSDIDGYNASEHNFGYVGADNPTLSSSYQGSMSMMSYLARVNYNYDNRYLLTASGRVEKVGAKSAEEEFFELVNQERIKNGLSPFDTLEIGEETVTIRDRKSVV